MFVLNILFKAVRITNDTTGPLVDSCRLLIQQLEQMRIEHAYREANEIADALTKFAATMEEHFALLLLIMFLIFCKAKFIHL
ncbi:hypothetical protein SLA2020_513800 [Shorea laevis]